MGQVFRRSRYVDVFVIMFQRDRGITPLDSSEAADEYKRKVWKKFLQRVLAVHCCRCSAAATAMLMPWHVCFCGAIPCRHVSVLSSHP